MSVVLDQEGSSGELTTKGWRFERLCTVTGLTGSAAKMLLRATQRSGVPKLGSQYPGIAKCVLKAIRPVGLANRDVQLRLIYEVDDTPEDVVNAGEITVGASLSSEQISTDLEGDPLWVKYTNTLDVPLESGLAVGATEKQGAEISGFLPSVTASITVVEQQSPGAKAKTYVGTVNAGAWKVDRSAKPAEWLCTGITGRSNDGGKTYIVEYGFQYRKVEYERGTRNIGWDVFVRYTDNGTGKPPPDVYWKSSSDSNGMKRWSVYERTEFDKMFS